MKQKTKSSVINLHIPCPIGPCLPVWRLASARILPSFLSFLHLQHQTTPLQRFNPAWDTSIPKLVVLPSSSSPIPTPLQHPNTSTRQRAKSRGAKIKSTVRTPSAPINQLDLDAAAIGVYPDVAAAQRVAVGVAVGHERVELRRVEGHDQLPVVGVSAAGAEAGVVPGYAGGEGAGVDEEGGGRGDVRGGGGIAGGDDGSWGSRGGGGGGGGEADEEEGEGAGEDGLEEHFDFFFVGV